MDASEGIEPSPIAGYEPGVCQQNSQLVAEGGIEPPGSKTPGYEPGELPTTHYPAIDWMRGHGIEPVLWLMRPSCITITLTRNRNIWRISIYAMSILLATVLEPDSPDVDARYSSE